MKVIKIHGPIVSNDTALFYNYVGWDCCCPRDVEEALEKAEGEDVTLEINSPGGVCVSGYEIYNKLRGYSGNVTAHVVYAASAATLIASAADKALIAEAGIYMIQNTQGSAEGDYRQMDGKGTALREFNESLLNVYEKKTGMNRDDIQRLMDADTYMGPKKAIEYKFADGLIPDSRGENLMTAAVAAQTQIVPENIAKEIMAMLKNTEVAPVQQTNALNTQEQEEEENMTLEEFKAQSADAAAELAAVIESAKNEGAQEERTRMKDLDELRGVVSEDDLNDAKYGENPTDAKTLAYQSAMKNKQLAQNYMESAKKDSDESGAADVGNGKPDAGEGTEADDERMAAYINKMRGGVR